ncbi:MAG: hypothetical protein GW779_05900 [Candidatus Altiarchaeum hamiconexum]|uniref:Uncharacterized protein n=1 Tax=Candidatus Altarchaeum hamiconexum TaxID=1803513 RepID=A0A8J8CF93_9ARCH|nr:hypothetical protein [Candidatus Altarchaeum hamiconexum]NCS91916.1 hypothetical protein [Candidatus Altarchaeum hamiconexum]PIN67210.1 MAG: hypothetical protein COV98_04080 [Candidatus Altarchaeum sp. CG12_big_fil_rev_8_21_14_0_65_33_22]
MKKAEKNCGIDEVNVIENYTAILDGPLNDDDVLDEMKKKYKSNIAGLKKEINDLKTTEKIMRTYNGRLK